MLKSRIIKLEKPLMRSKDPLTGFIVEFVDENKEVVGTRLVKFRGYDAEEKN